MATADLQTDLDLHHLGEDFYLHALDQISTKQLAEPSSLPGWSRKHVAVHMTANAEAIMRALDWARTGNENKMYPSRQWRDDQIEEMVTTVSDDDVRPIAHEVAEEIRTDFATMPQAAWQAEVLNGQEQLVNAAVFVWARAREAFIHSLDLNIGFTTRDFPAAVIDRLIDDVEQVWAKRGETVHYLLQFSDRGGQTRTIATGQAAAGGTHENDSSDQPFTITGEAAEIVSYLLGRGWPASSAGQADKGASGADSAPENLPTPPRWL